MPLCIVLLDRVLKTGRPRRLYTECNVFSWCSYAHIICFPFVVTSNWCGRGLYGLLILKLFWLVHKASAKAMQVTGLKNSLDL